MRVFGHGIGRGHSSHSNLAALGRVTCEGSSGPAVVGEAGDARKIYLESFSADDCGAVGGLGDQFRGHKAAARGFLDGT